MTTPTQPMEAGRELDALIDAQVMESSPEDWSWRCIEERHLMNEEVWCFDCQKLVSAGERIPPLYSTDIGTAFLVVETLCPTRNISEAWMQMYTASGKWAVNFHRDTRDVFAETLPHAICLAALAALADRER